jgi:hypothetical protein
MNEHRRYFAPNQEQYQKEQLVNPSMTKVKRAGVVSMVDMLYEQAETVTCGCRVNCESARTI